ncbi:MAG: radical SAM protein, partial [Pseudomonadota bacterium]
KKDISAFSLFHEFRHFGYSYEHIGNQIRQEQPFIVGISSLFTAYADQAVKTAQAIKKFYPQCLIVIGGHHPTIFPETVLDCDCKDFVIRGEGELPMAELCRALTQEKDIKKIPGLCFKNQTGYHICDPFWASDLADLPGPAMNLINYDFYQRNKRISTAIVSSRGCPMQCSYCSVSATSSHGGYRQRPVNDVAQEIETLLKAHDVGFIDFEDENLCLDKSWFFALFNRITPLLSEKNIELRAMNGLYPPSIDEDIVQMMHSAGFKTLNLALGSTSTEQLTKFKRNHVGHAFEKALTLAGQYGLECVSYLIGAAVGQTAISSLADLLYLASKRTLIGFSIFYPAPGSLDYAKCQDRHLLPEHFCQMRSTALPIEDTTTRLQAVTLLRLTRILNFMKALMDMDGCLPKPEKFSWRKMNVAHDRTTLSKKILQGFLFDGIIRGVMPDGEIYQQQIDQDLAHQFVLKIKQIQIIGVKCVH